MSETTNEIPIQTTDETNDETGDEVIKTSRRKRRKYKPKPRRLRNQYSTNHAREELIAKARVATTNALEYPEIKQPLLDWGLKESVLTDGVTLYKKADEALNFQVNQKQDLGLATHELNEMVKAGRKMYMADLKLARVVLDDNVEHRVSMGLRGRRKMDTNGWMDQARLFYTNGQKDGALKILKKIGLNRKRLQAGLDMLRDIEDAESKKTTALADSIQATIDRDDAFEALSLWLKSFTQVAKIVFNTQATRQTLERLRIPAITTKKRRKKTDTQSEEMEDQVTDTE